MYPHRHASTGSMGELSQNSLKLVFMYASTPFGILSKQFRTEKLAVAFVLTQILTKLSAFKTW